MSIWDWLLRLLPCRHRDTYGSFMYREYRRVGEDEVLHLVCDRCGAAQPALRRSAQERLHIKTVKTEMKARRTQAVVQFKPKQKNN